LPPTSPTTVAPWHYTRSNFSAGSLPSASLPRVPPPTSSTIRRAAEAGRATEIPQRSRSPAPRKQSKTDQDPLGVL
jgi:TBC1 domain family protein 5